MGLTSIEGGLPRLSNAVAGSNSFFFDGASRSNPGVTDAGGGGGQLVIPEDISL
jgi:hypothetical protein